MLTRFLRNANKKILIPSLSAGLLVVGGFGVYFFSPPNVIDVEQENNTQNPSLVYDRHPITGLRCANHTQRPFAVMMSIDSVTRPLSGISSADLVVEMPVVKDSITRIMALYACSEPEAIGSLRSSRHDFIPIAGAFDAIYAHWGGSNFALDELRKGVIDNIDALINPNNAFYRKSGIPMPHDGFTSYENLYETSDYLGYRLQTNFEEYSRIQGNPAQEGPTTLSIGYPTPFNLGYIYNREENSYKRWRGGTPETDMLNGEQVEVKVIAVLKTTSQQVNADYNDVEVAGSGEALIFQNGRVYHARWEKGEGVRNRLHFVGEEGEELGFVPGKMWINYVDYGTTITWGEDEL